MYFDKLHRLSVILCQEQSISLHTEAFVLDLYFIEEQAFWHMQLSPAVLIRCTKDSGI